MTENVTFGKTSHKNAAMSNMRDTDLLGYATVQELKMIKLVALRGNFIKPF